MSVSDTVMRRREAKEQGRVAEFVRRLHEQGVRAAWRDGRVLVYEGAWELSIPDRAIRRASADKLRHNEREIVRQANAIREAK